MISIKSLKQFFLLILIIALGIIIFKNLSSVYDSILGALLLYFLSKKPVYFLISKRLLSKRAANIVYIFFVLTVIIVPFVIFTFYLKNNIQNIFNLLLSYKEIFIHLKNDLNLYLGFNIIDNEFIKKFVNSLSTILPKFLNSLGEVFTTLGMMLVFLFFMLFNGKQFQKLIINFTPLNQENKKIVYDKMYQSIVTNSILIPLVSFVQAIIALLSYLIVDVPNAILWFIITFLFGMVPIVGSAIVYIPIGLLQIIKGNNIGGIFIIIWGIVVVSLSDNFLRLIILKKFEDVNPAITFLGLIVGLEFFGFLGLIYGPILISIFFMLIDFYKKEYS